VKVNCAAVPASLLENELFGSAKGSVAGPGEDRPGLVEIADGGTLFLKEVGAMSLELQDKLLDLLRDGTYTRAGSGEMRAWHVRIICASNGDLRGAVQSGAFRKDLFDRIQLISLCLPPLRDRRQDIPQLCEYFLQKLSRQFRRGTPQLSPGTVELLKEWYWPGNLRELENWIARTVILGGDEALGLELKHQLNRLNGPADRLFRRSSLKEERDPARSLVNGALILKALQANRGNRRKAADELKMSYRALLFRLRSVGMTQKRRSHRGPPRTY
jgi:transcriptional regulator with PAS, ATPase and Fis domain